MTWGETRGEDRINDHVARASPPYYVGTNIFYGGTHACAVRARTLFSLVRFLKQSPLTDIDAMETACCDQLKSYILTDPLVARFTDEASDNPQVRVLH